MRGDLVYNYPWELLVHGPWYLFSSCTQMVHMTWCGVMSEWKTLVDLFSMCTCYMHEKLSTVLLTYGASSFVSTYTYVVP